jgi:signal transduction histidine kinase/CheY-like chemotaxis protein
MDDTLLFFKMYVANISIILTMAYLMSLLHKYVLRDVSKRRKELLFVMTCIIAGWTSIYFGKKIFPTVIFDLRFIPLIIAPMFLSNRAYIVVVGAGIGVGRLFFGLDHAAWAGFANVFILGLVTAALYTRFQHTPMQPLWKIGMYIVTVNIVNVIDIAVLGVIPAVRYLSDIAPATFASSILLSAFFAFILRDFQLDYLYSEKLKSTNIQLEQEIAQSGKKTRELEKTKQELEFKAQQVMLTSKYKTEFLANMSHELRTPLNSMLILSELLAENRGGSLGTDEVQYARLIHSAGGDLLDLINDILDLTKVEAGHMHIEVAEFNLSELPAVMEQVFSPVSRQKNLAFATTMDDDVPGLIHTDGMRVQQIVKNLLSNAFKFTAAGQVSMHIRKSAPAELGDDSGTPAFRSGIAISIADTGIGISKDNQRLVFEAFHQADGTTSRKFGGTGLGLSISREFSQLLGGRIELESEEGRGSVFTLILPDQKPAAAFDSSGPLSPNRPIAMPSMGWAGADQIAASLDAADPAQPETDTGRPPRLHLAPEQSGGVRADSQTELLRGKTVLIADDDSRNIFAIKSALQDIGCTVLEASSGTECLDMLLRYPKVDLILMDIMMPEMNGYEAMRMIRLSPKHRTIPIIALTAKAMPGDRAKCMDSGASDYISKPFLLEDLFRTAERLMTEPVS